MAQTAGSAAPQQPADGPDPQPAPRDVLQGVRNAAEDKQLQPLRPQQPADLAAAAVADSGPLVHMCWEQALDRNSGHWYYFNRATGARQWHLPEGLATGPAAAAAVAAAAAAAEIAGEPPQPAAGEAGGMQPPAQHWEQQVPWYCGAQQVYEPGYYYRDAFGRLQGPFDVEQLQQWRGMLPMDLPVLQLQPGGAGSSNGGGLSCVMEGTGDGGCSKTGQQAGRRDAQGGDLAGCPGDDEQQAGVLSNGTTVAAAEHEAAAGGSCSGRRWQQHELAALLGDEELLDRWRLENAEQAAAWPGTAPPAAAFEAECAGGSANSLAHAVLCGLPAHDEAVAVARVAAASGRTIQEVADWQRERDYSVTGYRVAARGRIQAGGGQESLYAEASSWANPAELEQQLARAADRRKRGLTGEELRQVRQRKQELKEKKRTAWLFS